MHSPTSSSLKTTEPSLQVKTRTLQDEDKEELKAVLKGFRGADCCQRLLIILSSLRRATGLNKLWLLDCYSTTYFLQKRQPKARNQAAVSFGQVAWGFHYRWPPSDTGNPDMPGRTPWPQHAAQQLEKGPWHSKSHKSCNYSIGHVGTGLRSFDRGNLSKPPNRLLFHGSIAKFLTFLTLACEASQSLPLLQQKTSRKRSC